jgi:hypothetical protein
MPKFLSEGHIKFTILTSEPANPFNPTVLELNAGIDASCKVTRDDFTWSAGDSDKVAEAALCDLNNVNSLGASNFTTGITIWRIFDSVTGAPDPVGDALFTATKAKGTRLWGYARETGKLATDAWASGDEIYLGGEVLTDEPQKPANTTGYIKRRIPLEPQSMRSDLSVA